MDDAGYAESIQGNVDQVTNAPGRRFFSPREMSLQAPFVDAAAAIDPVNRGNTFISYYTWGAALGLGLENRGGQAVGADRQRGRQPDGAGSHDQRHARTIRDDAL